MSIAEIITKLMETKGLSKYKLAKESGVPYTTLIKILDGTTKNPQIESLKAIAKYFEVDVDDILDGAHDSKREHNYNEEIRDFRKLLKLDDPIIFDGIILKKSDKEKVLKVMEALFGDRENKDI
ncbi:helix-turn-helix domain-containing protein [Paenibacillus maysiensis]|uniref:helix-turn-helix domain-containing protein n=1 Tax=Paenibacillus maysiensis TaxID=1155954 RepID=UPI00047206FC|nr:helix-turn-helix transcriptional regulator [Paenibacillus maysiensis]